MPGDNKKVTSMRDLLLSTDIKGLSYPQGSGNSNLLKYIQQKYARVH